MSDLFSRIGADAVSERVRAATASGHYPYFRAFSTVQGPVAQFEGREVVMLGSNNYLGLTMDERVQHAAAEAIATHGTSMTGSRFLNGTLELHLELERRLAAFVEKDCALVFATGYQAIVGTITALVGRHDMLVLDRDAHACAIDGARMSRAGVRRFRHNDVDHLAHVLASLPDDVKTLVVIDGVYSMTGAVADLPNLLDVCRRYDARLLLDDAHGIGVLGEGRGTSAAFGLTQDVDLIAGTFSKSFASVGGFVAGDRHVIEYIKHMARSFIYSASLPPANVATALAVLDVLEAEPTLVDQLRANADQLRQGLTELGYVLPPSDTPIIALPLQGGDQHTLSVWQQLIDHGVYVNPVVQPATPDGTGLLRLSVTARHQPAHIQRALAGFAAVRDNLQATQ